MGGGKLADGIRRGDGGLAGDQEGMLGEVPNGLGILIIFFAMEVEVALDDVGEVCGAVFDLGPDVGGGWEEDF
jgi:hypothetical protein